MPTFKNIRIPMRNGKTRLQRVQVLKSGKLKFVKNLTTSRKSNPKKRSASTRSVRKTANKGKMFRTISATGALEDIAWGFVGFNILGQSVAALPMVRTIQGIQGHVLDRRGKRRLVDGILDLITIWVSRASGRDGFRLGGGNGFQLESIVNLLKVRPL